MMHTETVFLIVDDFEPMRRITSGQLRTMGAKFIVTANNGAEALRILREQKVDIVLSDWNMPVMNGFELLQKVRSTPNLSSLPFIIITAEVEHKRIKEAIDCGVDDLLIKPYTALQLATRVERVLSSQKKMKPKNFALAETEHLRPEDVKLGSPPTILVVDDVPDNLLLLSRLFEDEYRVLVANSGMNALAICQSNAPPDLVMLDIMMPEMDGFEVARRMREHPTSETIPVIFVTANHEEGARLQGMELGAVDFVVKPIDPDILKPRVRNFMRHVELRRQLQANYDSMLELNRLREDVENITRHDMKAPLAGVIGFVQALAEDEQMNRQQVKQLRTVEETALRVLDMINLSFELFKMETDRFKLDAKPVNIQYVLQRIIDLAHATFSAKELSIVFPFDVEDRDKISQAWGDSMLCYSLFQNLIKNACEAAPQKGNVNVRLIDETSIYVVIENDGAIPLEIRDRFFNKFVTSGKHAASGLGAYSAKLLVLAQDGNISMHVSDQEDRTTIIVTLPRYDVDLNAIEMLK